MDSPQQETLDSAVLISASPGTSPPVSSLLPPPQPGGMAFVAGRPSWQEAFMADGLHGRTAFMAGHPSCGLPLLPALIGQVPRKPTRRHIRVYRKCVGVGGWAGQPWGVRKQDCAGANGSTAGRRGTELTGGCGSGCSLTGAGHEGKRAEFSCQWTEVLRTECLCPPTFTC